MARSRLWPEPRLSFPPSFPLPGWVDLCHMWGGTSHEEEGDTEDHGDGHDAGSHTGNGLQRENETLHEDSSKQHPQGCSREVHSTCKEREAGLCARAWENVWAQTPCWTTEKGHARLPEGTCVTGSSAVVVSDINWALTVFQAHLQKLGPCSLSDVG